MTPTFGWSTTDDNLPVALNDTRLVAVAQNELKDPGGVGLIAKHESQHLPDQESCHDSNQSTRWSCHFYVFLAESYVP